MEHPDRARHLAPVRVAVAASAKLLCAMYTLVRAPRPQKNRLRSPADDAYPPRVASTLLQRAQFRALPAPPSVSSQLASIKLARTACAHSAGWAVDSASRATPVLLQTAHTWHSCKHNHSTRELAMRHATSTWQPPQRRPHPLSRSTAACHGMACERDRRHARPDQQSPALQCAAISPA